MKLFGMKKIVIISLLFVNLVCFSQEVSKIKFTSDIKPGNGKHTITYEYNRIFIQKNIFKEKGLFSRDTISNNTTELFKIEKDKWYFKRGKKWITFFDSSKNIQSTILINGRSYLLKWKKLNKPNEDIYKLKLHPVGFSISHIPSYLFTPNEGIVAICGDNVFFVREDKEYLLLYCYEG